MSDVNGALVIDKPEGVTSHDVVAAARRLLGVRRIGHVGTLDPFSTGVLVLLAGPATRLARFFRARDKTYRGVIRFGYATDTMDGTGEAVSDVTSPAVDPTQVRAAFREFTGTYQQRPPAYSAKKVAGMRAYRLARRRVPVELPPAAVTVHQLDLEWIEGSRAGFTAKVSSGTYIRSLVNDIGARMGVGAHLEQLRRTALGEFQEREAMKLETLAICLEHSQPVVIPAEKLLPELPAAVLTGEQTKQAAHGAILELPGLDAQAEWVRLMDARKRLVALGRRQGGAAGTLYHPEIVLVSPEAAFGDGGSATVHMQRSAGAY